MDVECFARTTHEGRRRRQPDPRLFSRGIRCAGDEIDRCGRWNRQGQPSASSGSQRCSCSISAAAAARRTAALALICSDMWKPYLQVVAKKAGHALHILDRFHIAKHMSDAIDHVRRAEVDALRQQGRQPLLTKTRWLLLKRPANQTREQRTGLRELVQHNLRAMRAMLLRARPSSRFGTTARSGGGVPGRLVCPGDVFPDRADEEGRAYAAASSAAALELVSGTRGDFRRRCRRLQQQSEADHQKGIRLSVLSLRGNRLLPYVGSATGTGSYPQILLRTPFLFGKSRGSLAVSGRRRPLRKVSRLRQELFSDDWP
jgi:Transposase